MKKIIWGGDCLNTGCVPSKSLIRTTRILAQARRASEFGLRSIEVDFRFDEVMDRVRNVIRTIEPHDSPARYTALGVDCIQGSARICSPWTVEVNGRLVTTRGIIIATGAEPVIPGIPGLEKSNCLTSNSIWDLRKLPKRLVVLGGGPIGLELGQCFSRLGSRVSVIEGMSRILPREDADVSDYVSDQLRREGLDILTDCKAIEVRAGDGENLLICEKKQERLEIAYDALLVAVGRRPDCDDLGLEELGIERNPQGGVGTNEYLQTTCKNIYACGDVAGPMQFTNVAAHQAWFATVNTLLGGLWRFRPDYSAIPRATFTEPEIASTGINEQQAEQEKISYEISRYELKELDRAIIDGEAGGWVKVLTVPGKDQILGVTIVGEQAGEIITEFTSAMRQGYGLNRILGSVHIYPTLSEAGKFVAGNWKKAHAPEHLLRLAEAFFRFHRN